MNLESTFYTLAITYLSLQLIILLVLIVFASVLIWKLYRWREKLKQTSKLAQMFGIGIAAFNAWKKFKK